ncbi:hypothetical protein D3C78_1617010 [compost metagenome]
MRPPSILQHDLPKMLVAFLVAERIGHGVQGEAAVQHGLDAGGVQGPDQVQLVATAADQQA